MIQILFEVAWAFIKGLFVYDTDYGVPRMKNPPPPPQRRDAGQTPSIELHIKP